MASQEYGSVGSPTGSHRAPSPNDMTLASPSSKSIYSETATPKLGTRKSLRRRQLERIVKPHNSPPEICSSYSKQQPWYTLKQPPLPSPKHSAKCPLFSCFYAEFDNIVGPKVCFQTPPNFMEQQIDISAEQAEKLLDQTFDSILHPQAEQQSTSPWNENENTIFDSCSEFIITGNELTGNIINLSTHNIHVLSRPTMISNERYERNSLLFCVGFILRRTEDPRPFRPLLNKWALALRDLELEFQYLSTPARRPLIQRHLERLLVSLNSKKWECNLLLNEANVLHLKLFHPPKVPAFPVQEYAVPIFLRRDRQMHLYDWDLAINWVSLHIDGVTNARQISVKAEVDMEMVLSCLRVLRHHGVIALVDMFFFTNRYECTDVAAAFLEERNPRLLNAAVNFVMHQFNHSAHLSPSHLSASSDGHHEHGKAIPSSLSDLQRKPSAVSTLSPRPEERDNSGSSYRLAGTASQGSHDFLQTYRRAEFEAVKLALMELYCKCNRNESIGEFWVDLLAENGGPARSTIDWKKMFQMIDHRRFASFGVVHGLLRRIHDFPLLIDGRVTDSDEDLHELCDSLIDEELVITRDRNGRGTSRHRPYEDERRLSMRIAAMMDGRHCDDELVCAFEKPFQELLDMMKDYRVTHVYAPSAP